MMTSALGQAACPQKRRLCFLNPLLSGEPKTFLTVTCFKFHHADDTKKCKCGADTDL